MIEERGHRLLSAGIAATLRVGTMVAIGLVTTGYLASLVGGGAAAGDLPLVELIGAGGGETLLGLGLLSLTLIPVAVLVVAAAGFGLRHERRMRNLAMLAAAILVGSLVVALVVGRPAV